MSFGMTDGVRPVRAVFSVPRVVLSVLVERSGELSDSRTNA
jgi:hypothetical protein